jgi:hypothetical protein
VIAIAVTARLPSLRMALRASSMILLGASAMIPLGASPVFGQTAATPMLEGTAFVGDAALTEGVVVLHHLSDGSQGDLDSLSLADDGSFSFPLPRAPDPVRSDVFFASVRHQGVLYFGPAITTAIQLDSIYEIHTYDTLVAPMGGMSIPLQSRSIFFEPDTAGWRVTDLFQLRNDENRTIVTRSGGIVWSHPLPAEAREVTAGEGELAFDAAEYEDGSLVVRAAIPPGERLFVVRYTVDSPMIGVPNRGPAEAMDVLVREPAPPIDVDGLELIDRIELEAGSTYMRFAGTDVAAPVVTIVGTEALRPPRVEWVALLLATVLAAGGLLVLRPGRGALEVAAKPDRNGLLLAVARLDEDFTADERSQVERDAYERRRAELLQRIRAES